MGDMDSNTCLLDIIDDPNALSEFFKQGPETEQVTTADSTDDLDDLQATLWDDDPNFVSSTTSEITIEALSSTGSLSQSTLLPQAVQSVSTFATTAPSPSVQAQQVVGVQGSAQGSISGTTGVVQVASPYQSAAVSPLPQPHGSPQVLSQTPSPMAPGTRASPMLQLATNTNAVSTAQQQVFLQPTATATQIQQQVRSVQPQATLQTVQVTSASSPAPSNVVNLGQVVRPVAPSATQVQLRPQQVVQAGTAQGGQVSLQGTIIQTSTGSRILIQQPVVPGQPINLANLQGLQIRPQVQATQIVQQGQVIQAAQNNQPLVQGQVQQTQLVQQAAASVQGQVLQTSQNAAQVVQQGQLLQQSQQNTQVLQSHNAPVLQQQSQVVQQQGVQQSPLLQQNVVNPTAVQPQQQQGQTIGTSGGIQLAGNQLPSGVSVVNINGQQILIQRALAPGGQNIILRAVPNVIQIQAPAPSNVNQVGGQVVATQPQLLITQPTGQIQQSQIQLPQGQLASVGQPQVLGNLNVLNDSQNVNINVNILPAQGQGSASQALQQLQQSKVQLAGGQVVQAVQSQGSNQTTPIKILPKSNAAGNIQGVNIQQIQQHLLKPVASTVASSVASTLQTVTGQQQQLLNAPASRQDILSAAAALNDIPLQVQPPTSQSIKAKPVINTAASMPNSSPANVTSQVQTMQTIKVEQKPQFQAVKVEQKPLIHSIKTEPTKTILETSHTMQSPITVIKTETVSSQPTHVVNSLPQQQVTPENSLGSVAGIGSAAQGLKALAANSGGTTQTVTIHHQPLQPKSSGASINTSLQQISIPAISQGSVVTTMATIQPGGTNLLESTQNTTSSSVVLNQTGRSHPAPNVNIANMPHLQTLPPKAAMLIQNSSTGVSNTSDIIVTSVSTVTTVSTTVSAALAMSSAPTIIPTQVTQAVASKVAQQQGTGQARPQGINVGNTNLLQRIHQQIKILLTIPNRTEQQQKMLQQLAQIEKKITSQTAVLTTGNDPLKLSQEQQQPLVTTGEQQNKALLIQQQVKNLNSIGVQQTLSTSTTTNSITNTAATGPAVTQQLVVATVQPTLPGSSKLIFTSTPSVSGSNSLPGLLSTASSASSVQKTNVVTLQPAANATHLKIGPGISSTKASGLIQLKPILPSQSVASSSTTGVLAGSSSVTVSNVGATTGGKLLITQPAQQTGKVQIAQIQLPPGVKEKLQQQLAKLPPEQQELFKKHQPQVLLRLQQQLMKQQQGGAPATGITKIPITVNAGTSGATTVLQSSSGTTVQPLVVGSGSTPRFIIKRQVFPPQPLTRSQLISQQLARDQKAATQPDCKNPFKHYRDACQRLLRFHVFQDGEANYAEILKEEEDFDDRCLELMGKKENMFNKFELLTYKEAMRERITSESVMLEKLFLQEESKILREEKHQVLTDPESFVPRPSKRTKPSPETEEDEERIKTEQTTDDQECAPAVKVPKYGPTPNILSPSGNIDDTSVLNLNVVKTKQEREISPVKEEVNNDYEQNELKETSTYSAHSRHSSWGLKLVFKSSPGHAMTPEYKPDSPLDTSDSKSEELSLNNSDDSTGKTQQKDEGESVPFQDYISNNHLIGDITQGLDGSGKIDQQIEGTHLSSTGNVSEDDAAVAGLLSVSDARDNDVQLFGADFVTQESEFSSKQSELFSDSCGTNGAVTDGGHEVDSAVSGIIDDTNILQMDNDPTVLPGEYGNSQESTDDYHSTASDDDIQLVEPDNTMQMNPTTDDNLSSNSAHMPETIGGLNTEMESAINSILSLNDPGESNDFADMDEFMSTGGAGTEDATAMFPSVVNEDTTESTPDGQDDIEAAVQSILM